MSCKKMNRRLVAYPLILLLILWFMRIEKIRADKMSRT
jgi:hypothetical protein